MATAPAVASVGASVGPTNVASVAVPVPAGVAAGDVVVVLFEKELATALTSVASGFTEIGTAPSTTGSVLQHHALWRRATGADSGTYSFGWSGTAPYAEGVALRVTGCVGSGSPVEDFDQQARAGSNGTVTPACSTDTLGAQRLLLWSGANWNGGTWTPPTAGGTWTERYDDGACLTVASLAQAAAGSSGSVTGTCSASNRETAVLLALLPVPDPAAGIPPYLLL